MTTVVLFVLNALAIAFSASIYEMATPEYVSSEGNWGRLGVMLFGLPGLLAELVLLAISVVNAAVAKPGQRRVRAIAIIPIIVALVLNSIAIGIAIE